MSNRPSSVRRPSRLLSLGLAALTLLSGAAGLVQASSIASALDSASASMSSVSDSLQSLSQSSTGKQRVAAGDYQIIEIARAEGRPQHQRLHLQSAQGGEALLTLPEQTVSQTALQVGQTVRAENRAYGLAFSRDGRPFFLVLDDDWYRELKSRALPL